MRVVLVPTDRLKNNEDVKNHQYIELGKLKETKATKTMKFLKG